MEWTVVMLSDAPEMTLSRSSKRMSPVVGQSRISIIANVQKVIIDMQLVEMLPRKFIESLVTLKAHCGHTVC